MAIPAHVQRLQREKYLLHEEEEEEEEESRWTASRSNLGVVHHR